MAGEGIAPSTVSLTRPLGIPVSRRTSVSFCPSYTVRIIPQILSIVQIRCPRMYPKMYPLSISRYMDSTPPACYPIGGGSGSLVARLRIKRNVAFLRIPGVSFLPAAPCQAARCRRKSAACSVTVDFPDDIIAAMRQANRELSYCSKGDKVDIAARSSATAAWGLAENVVQGTINQVKRRVGEVGASRPSS